MIKRVIVITNIRNDGEHFEFAVNGETWRMRDRPYYPVVKTPEWIVDYFHALLSILT